MMGRPRKNFVRTGGVLALSTSCALLGVMTLTSCDPSVRNFSEEDFRMVEMQEEIEKLDENKISLERGEVANNFYLEGVGYYHAYARNFYQHPYQFQGSDGRYFVNGEWSAVPGPEQVASTQPSVDALEKVDKALLAAQQSGNNQNGEVRSGFGMGNMLMMYWLLSGNRGLFSGAGFRNAGQQAGQWQNQVNGQRQQVQSHAAANPGYRQLAAQRKAQGASMSPGSSVRSGFGSTARSANTRVLSSGS